MKKTLALVLAFALVFSTITVAFADTTTAAISADAQSCADLGMLVGEGNGVTAEYTTTTPSRLQAATMALRLRGLEAEAKAFTGTDNFADVDKVNYADGKAILGYLKAHSELGWAGYNNNFDPTSKVTAQQYYKTLLESLGYKQTTADVAGDFTYAETIAFAATKGLSKAATAANFTIADLATATVEGLKATVKGGTKTLATTLVDAKVITAEAAAKAGVTTPATTTSTTAKIDEVVAVANDKVKVTYDAAVDKTVAETVANYKVVVKGSTTALEVKSAVAEDTDVVVLTTAAQTGGTAYALTVGEVTKNFAGLAKVTTVPALDEVECTDTNTVEVTYTTKMDFATATNIANYTLNNGATVKAAELSSDRETVTLTTEGVADNKPYTLKVAAAVLSADLVAMKAASKQFTGDVDNKAVTIDKVNVNNNIRLTVIFDDDTNGHGVNEASAETLANYSVKEAGAEVAITSIVAYKGAADDDDYYDRVEITLPALDKSKAHTITIKDIVDGSVSANKMAKAVEKTFTAKSADDDAPEITDAYFISDTTLKVVFDDANRMDQATLTNTANYALNNDVTVTAAKVLDNSYPFGADSKTVLLTTSATDDSKKYILTVNNVADEFGNVIKANSTEKNIDGIIEDIIPPYVAKVKAVSETELELTFDNTGNAGELDKASAEDPTNYVLNGSIGAALEASLDDTRLIVTLTVPELVAGKNYKITMNNIKDLSGNAMVNGTANVIGFSGADNAAPEVESISVEARNLVLVTFDKPVKAVANGTYMDADVTGAFTEGRLHMVGNPMLDDTAILFKADDDNGNSVAPDVDLWQLTDNKEYTIAAIVGITDKHNNVYAVPADADDRDTFDGEDGVNDGPTVQSIEQTNVSTFRITFSEPVAVADLTDLDVADDAGAIAADVTLDGLDFDVTIDPEGDENDEGYSTIDLDFGAAVDADETMAINFTDYVTDYAGAPVVDDEDDFDSDLVTTDDDTAGTGYPHGYAAAADDSVTFIDTYLEDDDAPELVSVEATDSTHVVITYNEDIDAANKGLYKIVDSDNHSVDINTIAIGDEDYQVELTLDDALVGDDTYTLTVNKSPFDLAGNKNSDLVGDTYKFDGSSIKSAEYILGVEVVDPLTLKISTSSDMTDNISLTIDDENDKVVFLNAALTLAADDADADMVDDDNTIKVTLNEALVDGFDYTVTIDDAGVIDDAYTFTADVDNGDLDVETDKTVTFSDWDVDEYVVMVVYDANGDDSIATTERFFVIPDATDDTFMLDTHDWGIYSNGNDGAMNLTDLEAQDHDVTFTIEVYKVLDTTVDASDAADDRATYYGYIDNDGGDNDEIQNAPIYVENFTVDN